MSNLSNQFSERDLLIAVLNSIIAIGEQTSGKKMTVTVCDSDGNFVRCSGSNVDFT